MSKRKDLKDIRREKDEILVKMRQFPEYGDDYRQLLERYRDLILTEQEIMNGSNERTNNGLGTVLKVAGVAVSAIAGIGVPIYLADKAYDEEKQMKLKNGTIWNLIGKAFGPKQ